MSCAEAIRRCPQAVFVRPRHALYREYSRSVWETVRGIVPTVEQTGIDEGYLDLGEVAADFLAARGRRRGGADGRARGDEPHVLARRRAVQGRREDRERRAQAGRPRRRPAGKEARVPRAARRAAAAGSRAEGRAAAAGRRRSRRSAALAALADDELRRVLPGSVGTMLRDRARGDRPARARARHRADLDQRREHVRARHLRPRAPPRRAARHGGRGRGGTAARAARSRGR